MRNQSNFIIIALLLFAFTSCQNSEGKNKEKVSSKNQNAEKSSFDEDKEIAAIKEVIRKETESFFNRDYDEWKSYWIKEDYSFRAGNGPDSTYAMYGWENISDHIKNYDQDLYKGKKGSKYTSPKWENFTIKFNSENSAYAKWEQYNRLSTQDIYYKSEESRLMGKEGDEWKIVNVLAFWDKNKPVDSLVVQNDLKD